MQIHELEPEWPHTTGIQSQRRKTEGAVFDQQDLQKLPLSRNISFLQHWYVNLRPFIDRPFNVERDFRLCMHISFPIVLKIILIMSTKNTITSSVPIRLKQNLLTDFIMVIFILEYFEYS